LTLKIPKEVIIFPEKDDKWILMNVFSKTCLGVNSSCLEFIQQALSQPDAESALTEENKKWLVWEINEFSNEKGLLADPSRFKRKISDWPNPIELGSKELLEKLSNHYILLKDENLYRKKFQNKKSILDFDNFGNFHEQLGQHLLIKLRQDPEKWWFEQKFNDDLKSVRNNLYHAIQASFLKKYFPRRLEKGSSILDIGCGIGYYSNMMAQNEAKVLGVDPNENYIKLAKQNAIQGATFEQMNIGFTNSLEKLQSASFDYVFMSDALLFYFVPPKLEQKPDIQNLLVNIRRLLKPDGIFINVEPHYIFWLLPWLGEINYPFTVLTEYQKKKFGVTPTISQLIQTYSKGGFAVTWMEELLPEPSFEKIDSRAYNFAKEFPLWQLFELKPLKR